MLILTLLFFHFTLASIILIVLILRFPYTICWMFFGGPYERYKPMRGIGLPHGPCFNARLAVHSLVSPSTPAYRYPQVIGHN